MRSLNWRRLALALGALMLCGGPLFAQAADKKASKELTSFGVLRTLDADKAQEQAKAWLGKTDAATVKAFDAIWAQADRPTLDKVADTFTLGNEAAAKALADARDRNAAAPTAVPDILKDPKQSAFFRANLALAYAKALSNRKVYDEALDALKAVKVEQVVDPASYLFHRAVAEHANLLKKEAGESIVRLLDEVVDAPERYKMVAALMHFDMMTWRDKDLGDIARKMKNIEDRLELARGGEITQKKQREVVARLDEIIKQLENQQKGQGQGQGPPNGGQCPPGGQPGPGSGSQPSDNTQATSPMDDSRGGNGTGPGQVDPKKLKEMAEVWGKLPEKERAKAMLELTRDMPPRYREVIENYFKQLQKTER